ncbi:Clp protease N-terminal domain-containing protein [Nocardia stercoris]|uniref:Clp protease N-terminal domain-containing protein n=1 Tax=Nocardia stercoris TaxID=2483361 RepID=UPI001319DF2F|nr:Clp protease N-terminal domain-containing protein [Nocardia stercoris]
MSVGRKFVSSLTQQAARDLGCRRWPTGVLLAAILQTCRRDALTLPAAARFAADRAALAGELAELRDLVRRAGIDPDRAVAEGERIWRADGSAPWSEGEPRIGPHSQATLVLGAALDLARADPRAAGADGEPDSRVEHLFLAVLHHPDGAVHQVLRALGTDVVAARTPRGREPDAAAAVTR